MDKRNFMRKWFDGHEAKEQLVLMRKRELLKIEAPKKLSVADLKRAEVALKAAKVFDGMWDNPLRNINPNWVERQAKAANANIKPFKDFANYAESLKRRGFIRLGGGAFSTVVGHPSSDKVIKINRNRDGWLEYVKWAAEVGYAGTIAPKVYSWKWHDEGKFGVAVMERMAKTLSHVKGDEDARCVQSLFELSHKNKLAQDLLSIAAPGAEKFHHDLRKKFGAHGFDFHDGNFMIRKDGSFCVTDPVASQDLATELYKKRLKAMDFTMALAA